MSTVYQVIVFAGVMLAVGLSVCGLGLITFAACHDAVTGADK